MAVSSTPPTAEHAAHDALLLAAVASGDDLSPSERERADALTRECEACATLVADLLAIRAATADLPAPPRRRDFRLTDEDAARLRPTGWRRILAGFGSPGARLTGPAALGLATLGVAGLLLASVPSTAPPMASSVGVMTSGAGGAAEAAPASAAAPMELAVPAATDGARAAVPEASDGKMAPEAPPAAEPGGAGASPGIAALPGADATSPPEAGGAEDAAPLDQAAPPVPAGGGAEAAVPATDVPSEGGTGAPWLVAGSLALLAAGVLLGALRLAGRREAGR